MITITVTQDNKTLTISQPSDIPLTETDDSYYSWKHVFAVILFWLTFPPNTINSVMPDCEDCDVVEELNREHNAELSAQCERCDKTEGVNEGVFEGLSEGVKSVQESVQESVHQEVIMDENMEVKSCDNCTFEDLEETDHPCKECVEDDDTVYGKWTPKDITDEKETVKNCDNCQYGHTEQLSAECFGCVEAKTQVLTHWQPVSANDETTGKSERYDKTTFQE